MPIRSVFSFVLRYVLLLALSTLAACGGDGGGGASPTPVSISTQPVDQTVVAGSPASFSVAATGDAPSYQWQQSTDSGVTFVAIAGATGSSYTISSATSANNNTQFRVVVTGSAGNVLTSTAAKLTVTSGSTPPTIIVDVADVATMAGSDATFVVTAAGTSPTFQWQVTVDGTTFTDLSGATTSSLRLASVQTSDNGKRYRVHLKNSLGAVVSRSALLTVVTAPLTPTIITAPMSQSVVAPTAATFTVVAAGSPTPTYQWQRNTDGGATFTNIPEATSSSFTLVPTALTNSGTRYRVVVSNPNGSVTSDAATLTVSAGPSAPEIAVQPQSATVTVGNVATFSTMATGSAPLAYQWQVSVDGGTTFGSIAGASSSSYVTPAVATTDDGKRYRVVVTNNSGTVTSIVALLTVGSPLAGRTWTSATTIDSNETGDARFNASSVEVGIADDGTAIAVFAKVEPSGRTTAIYASRGAPQILGRPTWTPPLPVSVNSLGRYINLGIGAVDASSSIGNGFYSAVAPNGNSVVAWQTFGPCSATTYVTSGSCTYLAVARYVAASNTWEEPTVELDTPNRLVPTLRINSAGDIAILYSGWTRSGSSYQSFPALARRPAGAAKFATTTLPLNTSSVGLDENGGVIVSGVDASGFQLYRGTVAGGLNAPDSLLGIATQELGVAIGRGGASMNFFSIGAVLRSVYAGSITSALTVQVGSPVSPLPASSSDQRNAIVFNNGDVGLFINCNSYRWNARTTSWGGLIALPGNCLSSEVVQSPDGDSMRIIPSSGLWSTYDATRNVLLQSGYVFGTAAPLSTLPTGTVSNLMNCVGACTKTAVSKSGISVLLILTGGDSAGSSKVIASYFR